MNHVLAIDAGTGSIRAVLFNEQFHQVGVVQHEWTHLEDPKIPGSMNFDFIQNEELLIRCVKELLDKTLVDSKTIKAISATSMREGFVLYDKNGNELWACANVDARADQETERLKNENPELEDYIYKRSGETFALSAIPRLLWIKTHQPNIYDEVACITMINDWILYKLSGVLQVDPSNGSTTGLLDLETRLWSDEVIETCNLNKSIFPEIHEAGVVIGNVTEQVSALTGLSTETKIVSGGGDAQMATVGVGAINKNQAVVSGGSFWQQEVNFDKPLVDDDSRVRVNCHAVPKLWQIETIAFFPGLITRWFRDSFCSEEVKRSSELGIDFYEYMEQKAKDVPPGSYGVLPIFSDTMNFKNWRHASPSFINLSLDADKSGKHVLFRSLQENAVMVTLGNFKLIEEVTGYYPEEVIFAGGASNGSLWSQILADALGIPVNVPRVKEAAALGTAIFAAKGAGLIEDLNQTIQDTVQWEKTYYPNGDNERIYRELFQNWRTAYTKQLELADSNVTTHMWKAPGLIFLKGGE